MISEKKLSLDAEKSRLFFYPNVAKKFVDDKLDKQKYFSSEVNFMRERKIRYPLEMKNGVEVRSLKELQDNFDLDAVVRYYHSGKLIDWLHLWRLFDEEERVKKLTPRDSDLKQHLCEIFGIEFHDVPKIDPKESAWRAGRMNLLKKVTDDPKYLSKIDNVAFNIEDLYDLLDAGEREIYLCGNEFVLPAEIFREGNLNFHGVGETKVTIESNDIIDFEGLKITFEDIKFNEEYEKMMYNDAFKKFKEMHANDQAKRNFGKQQKQQGKKEKKSK